VSGDVILIPLGERCAYVAAAAGCTMILLHLPTFRFEEEVFLEEAGRAHDNGPYAGHHGRG
jgi:hypothetical protein